ncbi:phosphatase PAP2 family protein [Microbacterium sp.]|uniref:phosphatase PAP2 family protein n=1 Tax=Microbacterium sp. TaxID=51671 RepID=UPI003341881D
MSARDQHSESPLLPWPGSRRSLRLAVSASVLGIAAVLVTGLLIRGDARELPVDLALNAQHTPLWDALADLVATAFGPASAVVIGVLFAAVVAFARRSAAAGLAAGLAVGLSWAGTGVLKLIVARPRPGWSAAVHRVGAPETDPSFPSGHVAFVASLAVAAVLLTWRTRARWWTLIAGAVLTIGVGLSRMYTVVHYPSDVVAAMLCGVFGVVLAFAVIDALAARTDVAARIDEFLPLRGRRAAAHG